MEGVCLRYFNIFGPRQAADSPYSGVIAQFIYKMMAGDRPTINGDGTTSRDFTFVDNAVNANLLACTAPKEAATGRVFNVGMGQSHTLNDLYASLARILGFRDGAKYGPARAGDVQHSLASIERSRRELGYEPRTSFEEALDQTVAWYLESRASTGPAVTF
jgi:nucleoside-diphosphate-sugar epimerase